MKYKQWIMGSFKFLSIATAVGIFLLGSQINVAQASEDKPKQMHKMPEINPPAEFNELKNLVGSLKGTQVICP